MYFTTAEEFVNLLFGACLLFIYLDTFNNFGSVCGSLPLPADCKQRSRKR